MNVFQPEKMYENAIAYNSETHMYLAIINSIIRLQANKNPCVSLLQIEDVSKINEQFAGINKRLGKVDVGKSYKHTRILISCNRTK